jgi:predicted amidophosphoribosyltransferase
VSSVRCPKCGRGELREVGENHYLCRYCGHEFYACPVCGEAFAHQRQLAAHTKKHRGVEERAIAKELGALRELLEELLASQRLLLDEMKLVLAKLDQVLEKLDRALALLSAKPVPAPAAEAAKPPGEAPPDFLRDNPWLSVLRSRGTG